VDGTLVLAAFLDQGFFRRLLIVAVAACWGFALYDLVRRPLEGRKKAVWLVLILIFPVVGAIAYLVMRRSEPATATGTPEPGAREWTEMQAGPPDA